MSAKKGQVVGIISVKGGVGKTTVVSNLGASLANQLGKSVLLVEGNFSAPNLGIHLGVINPDTSIHDVIHSNKHIKEAIQTTPFGFDVIPGRLNNTLPNKKINPYKLHNRLEPLRTEYDYILIDSSPNLNEEMLSTIIASDELLVVTSPDFPTLSCTLHAVKVAKSRKTPIKGLILNKVRNKSFELSQLDIENAAGVPVISVINDHVKMLEAVAKTTPASVYAPNHKSVFAYHKLAADIAGEEYHKPPIHKRILSALNR